MVRRFYFVYPILFVFLVFGGCVSMGKYEMKEEEADNMSRSLKDLHQKYEGLIRENSDLKSRKEKHDVEVTGLIKDNESLKTDNAKLNDLLRARSDDLSKEIADLRRSFGELEMQNEKIKQDMAALQKSKMEETQKTSKIYEEMLEKLKNEIAQGQVTILELKGKLTVNIADSILFNSGKAEVKPEGLLVLQKISNILRSVNDKMIRIEGRTDNTQIVGSLAKEFPSSWELSAARAINVTRYLQQQGIDPSMLSAVAYGEYNPMALNDTNGGMARNRRIEILLVPKDAPWI